MNSLKIKRTTSEHEDFRKLVAELDKDLAVKNGNANDFFAQFNKIDLIRNVVVAYQEDEPVGCGAIKAYDATTMEVKRMFVPADKRGKGIASMVLQELEEWARELGYEKCILETGNKMSDAISLYRKNNYNIIPNYGQYADVAGSICFEKVLS